MNKLSILIIFIFSINFSIGQTVNFELIQFNGLNFKSSKKTITDLFKEKAQVFEPNYECGFLSSAEQGVEYQTIDFGYIKFTGNDQENYLIEKVDFELNKLATIKYNGHELSGQTSPEQLIEIFGSELSERLADFDDVIIIFGKNSDDGIRLEFKNNKLITFEYWSPC